MQATPTKLNSGAWGAKVQGPCRVGDAITITTRAGKSWDATIARVVWCGDGISLCATASGDTPSQRRGPRSLAGTYAPQGRTCPECGSSECPKAWDSRDLCDED